MKYFSMFTGSGGFEIGINNAFNTHSDEGCAENIPSHKSDNNNTERWRSPPLCVGFAEIDKYASELLKQKYPEVKNYGDATRIKPEELPDFDILVGGFPCQAFSIAGNRKGFDDTRGTLFFDIARIAAVKKPRFMVLENVKGLLSHDKGKTFATILTALYELGYEYQFGVVNSRYFGVPQNRERIIIIANLRGECRPEVFPLRNSDGTNKGEIASTTIDANYWKGIDNHGARTAIAQVVEATSKGFAEALEGDSINLSVPNSKTRRGRVGKGIAQTVDTGMQQYTLQEMKVRRLTPIECERLQGFPDQHTEGFSDTQRYKMMGNAVTTNVIQAVFEKLYRYI